VSPVSPVAPGAADDVRLVRDVVTVEVTDGSGATANGEVWVSTSSNDGPTVGGLSTSPSTVEAGGTISATVSASDPNGDQLSYAWSVSGSGWSVQTSSNDPARATVTAPSNPGATGFLKVVVSDGAGGKATASTTVSTAPNRAPAIHSLGAGQTALRPDRTTSVAVGATDPDGDKLNYTWSVSGSWKIVSGQGTPRVEIRAPGKFGRTGVVAVDVSDPHGATASRQLVLGTVSNQPPTIKKLDVPSSPVARGASFRATVVAVDPDGDSLDYSWSIAGKGWSVGKSNKNPSQATVQAPRDPAVTGKLTVEVGDGRNPRRTSSRATRGIPRR
ncbi:MAG: Ig-like domain-containing protein, partial [Bradymonadaceae bacterium]